MPEPSYKEQIEEFRILLSADRFTTRANALLDLITRLASSLEAAEATIESLTVNFESLQREVTGLIVDVDDQGRNLESVNNSIDDLKGDLCNLLVNYHQHEADGL